MRKKTVLFIDFNNNNYYHQIVMNSKNRKHSKKRDAIFSVIKSTDTHPAAGWVYNELKKDIPDLSLGTVYRNIKLLLKDGTLTFVGVFNGEERYDAIVEPHPHIVCGSCGRVADLPCPSKNTIKLFEKYYQDKHIIKKNEKKITIDYRKTIFTGLCADCIASCSDATFGTAKDDAFGDACRNDQV